METFELFSEKKRFALPGHLIIHGTLKVTLTKPGGITANTGICGVTGERVGQRGVSGCDRVGCFCGTQMIVCELVIGIFEYCYACSAC